MHKRATSLSVIYVADYEFNFDEDQKRELIERKKSEDGNFSQNPPIHILYLRHVCVVKSCASRQI